MEEEWGAVVTTEHARIQNIYVSKAVEKVLDNCKRSSLRLHRETSRPWLGAVPWPAHTEVRGV